MTKETQTPQLNIPVVSGSNVRTYSPCCPNCETAAKLDTQKYCCDECRKEYKAKLERKFSGNYYR